MINYSKEEVDSKILSIQTNRIIKSGNAMTILLKNNAKYIFEKKSTPSIGLETYMLTSGSFKDIVIWSGSDIEAPIKEKGTKDFIGGVHGDEQYESINIICDGVVLDINENYDMEFNNLTIFVKSILNRCETTTPVFTRYKKLEFKDDELIISNRLITLVDGFIVERYTGSCLYSVYKDLLNGYTINTKPELITSGGQNGGKEFKEGTFFCKGYTVTLKALGGIGEYYKGSVADFSSESRPRFKFYFDTINSSSGVTLNTNDELNASFSIKIK